MTSPRTVKAALAALLTAHADLISATIYDRPRTVERMAREAITLGNLTGNDSPFTAGGGQLSEYRIAGMVVVTKPNAEDAFDRAWSMFSAIQSVLATNDTLSDTVLDAQMGDWSIEEVIDPDNAGGRVEVEFTVEIRDTNE